MKIIVLWSNEISFFRFEEAANSYLELLANIVEMHSVSFVSVTNCGTKCWGATLWYLCELASSNVGRLWLMCNKTRVFTF